MVDLQPDIDAIKNCSGGGVIVTGGAPPDSGFDFFSRYFCPKYGINEVTNMILPEFHCHDQIIAE